MGVNWHIVWNLTSIMENIVFNIESGVSKSEILNKISTVHKYSDTIESIVTNDVSYSGVELTDENLAKERINTVYVVSDDDEIDGDIESILVREQSVVEIPNPVSTEEFAKNILSDVFIGYINRVNKELIELQVESEANARREELFSDILQSGSVT